ncbi:MAG: Acetyl-CoA:oxalate CoA-transferase [Acidimicrobiales bacterium]|nr:Acetyl-CoA:oxalate CoA-transferase [Acidimicrobiales bacterium]
MSGTGLLQGVRVLDLASVGPAARASRWLADYGAGVIKVGPVPRHSGVQISPPFHAYSGHRLMKRVLLDLKSEDGRGAFLRLAGSADVVIESFRPGVADRLGVGYRDVCNVKPDVVYCSTSGYGRTGPRSRWAGHDINYLAVGGFLACSQPRADGGPPIPGATIADIAGGGMQAVMSICAALFRREVSGEGALLDVSVADGVAAMLSLYIDEYLVTGEAPGPGHDILTGRYACYDLYECRDGRWISVGAIEPAFYANLCRALGLDKWVDHQCDDAVQDQIRDDFRATFLTRDRDDWVAELAPADTCVAPVNSIPELVEDEQFGSRALIVEAEHARHGRFRQVGAVLAGQSGSEVPFRVRDVDETDTEELLSEAGFSGDEITGLKEQGVVA